MKTIYPLLHSDGYASAIVLKRRLVAALCLTVLFVAGGLTVCAQQSRQKLPAADKIIGDYWKAVGGKKRLAAVRETTSEWTIDSQPTARARTQEKAPAAVRTDLTLDTGEISSAASARSAWRRGADGHLRTLTDAEAGAAKLQAALTASRLIDYKKLNVLARTVALESGEAEAAYVLEFSTRAGARLRYLFGVKTKLLLKIEDDARRITTRFGDYRVENGVLLPHRIQIESVGQSATDAPQSLTLLLQSVSFNTSLSDQLFDPPSTAALDIPALLMEVEKNQEKLDERVAEYAFTEKRIERKISDKGEVKEEKITVHEIYPLPGGGTIYKLISENGVPLSAERAAKQDKEIAESVAKQESAREKFEQKKKELEKKNGGPLKEEKKEDDDDVSVAQFLRACEFISPRREQLREREAVVFDFRPRPGFKPKTRAEDIITKLIGIVWIDPVDKQVIRLEAKLAEGYKMGGGLVASIKPGSSFVFEQLRVGEGVWLPRFMQVNFAAKVLIFKSIEANETREYSDYRHFKTEAGDYKLDAPAGNTPPTKP